MPEVYELEEEAYEQQRYDFLLEQEESGDEKEKIYDDGEGNPTIGCGFNLNESTVLNAVLKQWGFDLDDDVQDIGYRNEIAEKLSSGWSDTLQGDLDKIMSDRAKVTGDTRTTFEFVEGSSEVKNTFNVLAGHYENTVTGSFSSYIPNSSERITFFSFAWNQNSTNPLLGDKLTSAWDQNDRLATWYEIRYASNAPKNGERSLGVDNRRAQEAATFGLFSNPDGPADAQEALRVISFLESKQAEIDAYNTQLWHSNGDALTDTEKGIREAEISDALFDAEAMLAAEGLQVVSVSGDTAVITDTTSGAKIADVTIDTYFVEYKYTDHDYVETQTIFKNGATRTVFDDGIETGDYTSPEGIESSYLVTERGGSWVAFEGDNKQIYNNKDGSRIEAEFIGESVVVVTDLNTGQILDIVDQLAYESDRYFDWNNDEQYETSTPQPGQVGSGIGAEQQDGSVDFGEGAGIFSSSSGGADNVSGQQDALNTSNAAGDTSSSGTSTVQSKIDATIKLNIKDFTTVEQSGCFAADTPILMADGTRKRIADIATNDEVMSFDGLGELRKGRVKRTFEFADREVVELKGLRCPLAHRDEAA